MKFHTIIPDNSISLFVRNIWVFENDTETSQKRLPFFADGFPGLIFQQSENGMIVHPHSRIMPEIFLYGQTISPIELQIPGKYLIVIFQLYPFILKKFFGIIPESINDDCYYLQDSEEDILRLKHQLLSYKNVNQKVKIITNFVLTYFNSKDQKLDLAIMQAIEIMLLTNGQEPIGMIIQQINLNTRTFERRFKNETGLTPKQFAQIIQFQASLKQLITKDFTKLTDIVYHNGFSDQSHFIKVFKAYTGKTLKNF
ncbi:MAG: AraC family transcriptional regulator [Pedobacter sp.]|nr:MAG: AraC family transcriptional regulator [Pedobacter sp.]